jgi:3-hydroxybutyryl-CoA dehydrogenase
MKVLVVANPTQQEEWFSLSHDEAINLTVVTSPEDIPLQHIYDACIDLLFDGGARRSQLLRQLSPLTIINSVEKRLTGNDEDFIRINGWNTFLKRSVVEGACLHPSLRDPAARLFRLFGRTTRWTDDITGFITPRIVACIINEAFFSLEEGVSTEAQIDIAMKTGTNYPYGPFEWSKLIGLEQINSLLMALSREHNRYQPSTLLTNTVLA